MVKFFLKERDGDGLMPLLLPFSSGDFYRDYIFLAAGHYSCGKEDNACQ